MKFKIKFANGRTTTLFCDSEEKLKNELISTTKQFNSQITEINEQPVKKLSLGGFLVGTLLGGILGNSVAKSGVKKTAKSISKKTKKTISKTRKGVSEFRSASSKSAKFNDGGKIMVKKNTNNPNFLTINIEYEIMKGSPTALGKQTMSKQMTELSSIEAYKKALEIAKKIELKYNIEDIEVTDLENGIIQIFAVSNDFVKLPISELQKFSLGGSTDEQNTYVVDVHTEIGEDSYTIDATSGQNAFEEAKRLFKKENPQFKGEILCSMRDKYSTGGGVGSLDKWFVMINYYDSTAKEDRFGNKLTYWRKSYKVKAISKEEAIKKATDLYNSVKANKNREIESITATNLTSFADGGMSSMGLAAASPQLAIGNEISKRLPATTAAIDKKFAERVYSDKPKWYEDRGLQKMATGGTIGQEITFKHWSGDIKSGTIIEDLGNDNFEVASGYGKVLVNKSDFISSGTKTPERKKMFGLFAKGGGVRMHNGREYSTGRNWTNDHRHHNKSEDYEVPMADRKNQLAKGTTIRPAPIKKNTYISKGTTIKPAPTKKNTYLVKGYALNYNNSVVEKSFDNIKSAMRFANTIEFDWTDDGTYYLITVYDSKGKKVKTFDEDKNLDKLSDYSLFKDLQIFDASKKEKELANKKLNDYKFKLEVLIADVRGTVILKETYDTIYELIKMLGNFDEESYYALINKKDIEYWEEKLDSNKFALGGGIDLFEDYEQQPPAVAKLMKKYEETFEEGDYEKLAKAQAEFEKIGYTFDYYLDGVAYDLRPIGTKGKVE